MSTIQPVPFYQRDVINLCIGAFFALSCITFLDATLRAYRRRTLLDVIQAVAALCQAVNTMSFGLQIIYSGLDCMSIVFVPNTLFFIFQIGSTGIVIYKSTINLSPRNQYMARIGLSVLLGLEVLFCLLSSIFAVVAVMPDGSCSSEFQRELNITGKVIISILYLIALGLFARPLLQHLHTRRIMSTFNTTTMQGNAALSGARTHAQTNDLLRGILFNVTLRLSLAIVGYIMTSILSLSNVFGPYFFVEFSIQNYCAIVASNLCGSSIEQEERERKLLVLTSASAGNLHKSDKNVFNSQNPLTSQNP